jgi:hypothetical protein
MAIIDQLATATGNRDEQPNIALAETICATNDATAVTELVALLQHKNRQVQSDAIKVLYEIGERQPALIAKHGPVFLPLLQSKNNRLVWGAMTALGTIAPLQADWLFEQLPVVLSVADSGSVITRDHAVNILIHLMKEQDKTASILPLLMEQLLMAPTNQLPKYAEDTLPYLPKAHYATMLQTLQSRLEEIDSDSKRKRVEKVMKKLSV